MESNLPQKSEIFKFAYFPNYEAGINYLADNLAAEEPWSFQGTNNNSILKNYLDYTYRRLREENKIVYTTDNKYCCFNTGLFTKNWEDIFAFFEEYRNPQHSDSSPFCFKAFYKKSDNTLLKYFSDSLPSVANYFEQPELLIFNPQWDLIPDIDHIIEDNKDRFPMHLQQADSGELRRQLAGAIDEVRKKVRTNYKIAIPQYFHSRIQLLLPLCLTAGSNNPDLALVVHKLKDKVYTARTGITLRMAYGNARLIVKPQSDWLKP